MTTQQQYGQTILVVDDDADWRDFIYRVLGKQYPIQFATSGDEALSIARRTHPAVIILDIMMPGGKDGFTTFCELRDSSETNDIPIVMLTEVNVITDMAFDSEIIKKYLGSAPSVFLEKPIKPARLQKEIKLVLEPDRD